MREGARKDSGIRRARIVVAKMLGGTSAEVRARLGSRTSRNHLHWPHDAWDDETGFGYGVPVLRPTDGKMA